MAALLARLALFPARAGLSAPPAPPGGALTPEEAAALALGDE